MSEIESQGVNPPINPSYLPGDFTNHHAKPISTIRAYCIHCMGYVPSEVKKCTDPCCPLYPYRLRKRPKAGSKLIGLSEAIRLSKKGTFLRDPGPDFRTCHATPVHSMRVFCLQCMNYPPIRSKMVGESRIMILNCPSPKCPIFPYRTGHRPSKESEKVGYHMAILLSKRAPPGLVPAPRTANQPLGVDLPPEPNSIEKTAQQGVNHGVSLA